MLYLNPGCILCPHDSLQYPTLPQFTRFTRLPFNIRKRMWEVYLGTPSNVCIPAAEFDGGTTPVLEIHNASTPLLATSREARQIALQEMPQARPFDPEKDIIYLDSENFYSFCQACGRVEWPSATKHLALALPVADRGSWLSIAMRYLPQLESISIVLPTCKAKGRIDRVAPVQVPEHTTRVLRHLTDYEGGAVEVTADFWAETLDERFEPAWEHFVWIKSLADFVQSVEEELTLYARQEKPPFWNYETKSLGLRFGVMCFVEAGGAKTG